MMTCTWVACANPPIPDGMTDLVRNYTQGDTIPFGDSFHYECPPGYFFDEDRDIPHVSVVCLTNGSFSEPVEWKKCVDEKSIHQLVQNLVFIPMGDN